MKKLLSRIAKKSPKRERHASIVMRGGAVLAHGFNHDGRHAEVAALSKLWPSERRGTTVISFRLTPAGAEGIAFPCEKCQQFIRAAGVKKVVFSSNGEGMKTWRVR